MVKFGDVDSLRRQYAVCVPLGYYSDVAIKMFVAVWDSLRRRFPDREVGTLESETPLDSDEERLFVCAWDEISEEIELWKRWLRYG